MATLVHDDVLDEAPLRRGHPTAWATHGRAIAVATGDYLFARAFARARGARRPRCDPHRLAHGLRARTGRDAAGRAGARSRGLARGRARALPAQDRSPVRGGVRARRTSRRARPGRLRGPRPVRRAARPGLPAGRRRARLRGRPEAHGEDAGHRSARRHDVAAAAACRAIGRGARQRAARAGRGGGRAAAALARRRHWRARSRSAILPSGTRNAPRPSSSGHRAPTRQRCVRSCSVRSTETPSPRSKTREGRPEIWQRSTA